MIIEVTVKLKHPEQLTHYVSECVIRQDGTIMFATTDDIEEAWEFETELEACLARRVLELTHLNEWNVFNYSVIS